MFKKLSLFALAFGLAVSAQANIRFGQKIVGGTDAERGEFPYIVSLQGSWGHFCGGSLISENWVLTAAHCVRGGSIAKIVVGLHNQKDMAGTEVFKAAKVISHPEYNSSKMDYDFALIQLDGNSSFKPVALNNVDIKISDDSNIESTTAGWGYTKESGWKLAETLQKVSVPLVTREACNNSYKNSITERMICAGLSQGGKDSCQGDSGGPLIVKEDNGQHVLAGVVSWGEGCARPNKYGVYAKVSSVIDWIEESMK